MVRRLNKHEVRSRWGLLCCVVSDKRLVAHLLHGLAKPSSVQSVNIPSLCSKIFTFEDSSAEIRPVGSASLVTYRRSIITSFNTLSFTSRARHLQRDPLHWCSSHSANTPHGNTTATLCRGTLCGSQCFEVPFSAALVWSIGLHQIIVIGQRIAQQHRQCFITK